MFCSKNFRPALYPPIPVSPYTIHSYFCYIFPWTRCVKQVGYFLKKAARTFYVISYVHVTSLCRFLFIVSEINNISSRLAWVFYLWAVVMTSPVLYLFSTLSMRFLALNVWSCSVNFKQCWIRILKFWHNLNTDQSIFTQKRYIVNFKKHYTKNYEKVLN